MSNRALQWARRVRGISGTQKVVLLLLADTANDYLEAWPSATTLAADACLSERAVREALAELSAIPVIRGDKADGRPTVWTLLVPDVLPAWTPSPAARKSARGAATPERGASPPANAASPTPNNHIGAATPADGAPTPERGASPPRNVAQGTPERGAPITLSNPQDNLPPSAGAAPQRQPDARDMLWSEGVARWMIMTGVPVGPAKAAIGRFLKEARDDCALVGGLIFQAQQQRIGNPYPWVRRGIATQVGSMVGQEKLGSRLAGLAAWAREAEAGDEQPPEDAGDPRFVHAEKVNP